MLGGIFGAASGALGGILGGISRNKMLKKQMRMIDEQRRENQDWYDRRYNEDATQRADAQAMLTRTAEAIRQRNQAAAGSAAVAGGTEESVAATKAANAQAMSDAASQIAVAGARRKDAVEGQYMQRKGMLDETLRRLQGQKSSGLDVAAAGISGAYNGLSQGTGL